MLRIVAAALVGLSLALAPFGLSSSRSRAIAMGAAPSLYAQRYPSGEQLIHRMEQAALVRGTFHERLESITLAHGVRETLREKIAVDLRHHLLRQVGVDRAVRLPTTLLSRDNFERISVGYRSATRENGGAWSCQHFQPWQVHLIGRSTYLAGLGWPRRAVNLGPAVRDGVPVWRVRATVFGSGSPGGSTPARRANFVIVRSNDTLLREAWHLGKGSTASTTYARYGAPVRIVLPQACRARASSLTIAERW